ncbi:MAG TPA: hypothetical protein PKH39_03440 [Woeseiaceae bacterium]|nr:hypothetical protein [Woeseiaceae bacterium]
MGIRYPLISISLLLLAWFTALAAESEAEPGLKEIMQDLRDSLVEITDGLMLDDFDRIALGATGIAQHAPIPAFQATRIAEALGPEMPAFKQFDELVHTASIRIASAAREEDRDSVIVDYRRMVDGCLACHTAFKSRVSEVLAQAP